MKCVTGGRRRRKDAIAEEISQFLYFSRQTTAFKATTMIEKVRVLTAILLAIICGIPFSEAAKCDQNSTTIVCEQRSSANPLKSVSRNIDQVDTIIVHNSKIDLTDDLMNIDNSLPLVSLLNITDNSIERIGRRGFDKTHNVQYLYLSRNLISHAQPDPFMSLTRLELLEMNNALGGSAADKEEILRNLFHSKNDFTHLSEIMLKENNIETLHAKTFCGVQGFKRLDLSKNNLKDFSFVRKCFGDLKALFLGHNQIKEIPANIWDLMPSLTTLDISHNPLHCDCKIVELLKADDISFVNQGNTYCLSPSELEGKNVFDLPKDFCKRDGGSNTLFKFLVLVVIGTAVLFLYKKYRGRMSLSSKIVGYHNIEHEQIVQPEFV